MNIMFCPKPECNHSSLYNKFCVKCGTEMKEGPLRPATNTKCPKCRAGGVFPNDNFCGSCGYKFKRKTSKKRSNDEIYVLIVDLLKKEGKWVRKTTLQRIKAIIALLEDEKLLARSIKVPQREIKSFAEYYMRTMVNEIISQIARKTHRKREDVIRWAAKKFLGDKKGNAY